MQLRIKSKRERRGVVSVALITQNGFKGERDVGEWSEFVLNQHARRMKKTKMPGWITDESK